jgi:hypothetical protein
VSGRVARKIRNFEGDAMSANTVGWTVIALWMTVALFSLCCLGCQSYDYIYDGEKDLTKVSIDVIGTSSIRSGMVLKLPTITFELEESTLDAESMAEIIDKFGNMPLVELLKLLGAL